MHTYVFEHPEFIFEEVELGEDKMLGARRIIVLLLRRRNYLPPPFTAAKPKQH
jgi:hypothetical protein